MDMAAWLRELGLERYEPTFRENEIDSEVLPDLTEADLEKIGLPLGARKKLRKAIAGLHGERTTVPTEAVPYPRPFAAREAERRQLTVLFCDLVGSTELSARLDPEEMREVIGTYQANVAEVVRRWEGHVAKYMGDGALAYFGWPQAHEDDAERAVRAGLELVQTVAAQTLAASSALQVRVGIATGHVVVGDLGGRETFDKDSVVGETPNLAARLQALAEPGSVAISHTTRRLVDGLFELDNLGPQRLKGFAEPLAVWRVSGESKAEGRFEARHTTGLTPLVGRDEELSLLLRRWEQVKDGEGQVVLLSGEPGIGKSRLVRELRARVTNEPHLRLSYQCSPYYETSPLHPVIEQLERAAGFEREDTPAAKLNKLEALLARGTNRLDEAVPLIAALLGISRADRYPLPELTPQRQKQLTLEALAEQLEGLSAEQPVLLVHEDAHWIDPTTQELLGLVIERIQRLPVLAIITFRPAFQPSCTGQPHVSALALTRLGRRDGAAMVDRVVGGKTLPDAVSVQIVGKTDGVPLFVEELTKTVLESGLLKDAGDRYELSGPLPPLAIPSTLHDSLLARLDRLAPVKEVAQIGAAIGREFSHTLVAAVADRPEQELQAAIDQLVSSELVFRRGFAPAATYSFKHALVQDAAYGTLLRSKRQQLHARIAQVLEEQFPDTAETEPELLAHHCTQAGLMGQAVDYWTKAGQLSLARSATLEAVGQLARGLEVLRSLPEGPERDWRELHLQTSLGKALTHTKGWAAPEVGSAYARARELCRQKPDAPQLLEVLCGLWVYNLHCGRASIAHEIAEEMLRLAERQQDPAAQMVGHRALGGSSQWRGELAPALAHWEQLLTLYVQAGHHASKIAGVDLRVMGLGQTANILSWQGYLDEALVRSRQSLAAARELSHAFTLALALHLNCWVHQTRGDRQVVLERAAANLALTAEHGFSHWHANAMVWHGWALAHGGESEAGIAEMRQGLAADQALEMELQVPQFIGLLADSCTRANNAAEALDLLAQALTLVDKIDERWFEAELYRLRGEALVALSPERSAEAEACYRQALAVSREQGAHLWELRAAMSLVRLWRDQGRRAQARNLLAPIYNWFTEGFDTTDLREARGLLRRMN